MRSRARQTRRNRTHRMNMRMPGFTAEAGLQQTVASWRTGMADSARRHEALIAPQFCFAHPSGNYYTCCYCAYGYCFCTVHRVYMLA